MRRSNKDAKDNTKRATQQNIAEMRYLFTRLQTRGEKHCLKEKIHKYANTTKS